MHFGDYTFIFLLALVLFGPKKLPEIGRQLGKLLAEFRRASNEFKFQIQEELRNMEDEERRKKAAELEAARTVAAASDSVPPEAALPASTGPTILPPSIGAPVSASKPFAIPAAVDAGDSSLAPPETEVGVEPPVATETSLPLPVTSLLPSELDRPAHIDLSEAAPSESGNGMHVPVEEAAAHHD
ncbi:MAG TPA: twin-arginine translocase TatA/TatE family subunit [Acidobacteriaceae bacterium]|jgi:sec-independent protein translocase protein TatB|nr:twin-arginine translocase TatA/TatE family subunit [Acidobacteriaceae bacterium]